MRLKELEKRLRQEPDNLGLRVTVAGLMREAGRGPEAVELYRSVAQAYRDQGRTQQAIAVCRSILEIAPDDRPCNLLLAELLAPPPLPAPPVVPTRPTPEEPKRRSSMEPTPLPKPVPHHVADPTSSSVPRISNSELTDLDVDALPATEGATTRPGEEERKQSTGLAQAARTISGLFSRDVADELETRKRPKLESEQIRKISQPPPTVPVPKVDMDDMETPVGPRDSDTEMTKPRTRRDRDD